MWFRHFVWTVLDENRMNGKNVRKVFGLLYGAYGMAGGQEVRIEQ